MRFPRIILHFCLLAAVATAAGVEALPRLETAAAVRALRPGDAQRHFPVRLRGMITYYSAADGHAFLQDETGGIFFRPGDAATTPLVPGERVEINGVTVAGRFSPSVAGGPTVEGLAPPVSITKVEEGTLPEAPLIGTEQLQSGAYHDQFVRVRATIREVDLHNYMGKPRLGLTISYPRGTEGGTLRAYAVGFTEAPQDWVNCPVEIQGVLAGGGDEDARLRDVRLLVGSPKQISPQPAERDAAFSRKAGPLSALFQYQPPEARGPFPYATASGVISLNRPGKGFYLSADGAGLWVQTPEAHQTGESVTVIGFPYRDERMECLQDAIVRNSNNLDSPQPRSTTARQAAAGRLYSQLVTIEGELTDDFQQPGTRRLGLRDGGVAFEAYFAVPSGAAQPASWPLGSRLRLTGICEKTPDRKDASRTPAFLLAVESPSQVVVRATPPWLTLPRLRLAAQFLVAATVLCILWLLLLRRQVARQTRIIREQEVATARTSERQRIARELHDTLEQQLVGVHLHLDAVNDWLPEAPARVQKAITSARAMLLHSREEARRSVLELRSPALDQLGLVGAVRETLARLEGTPAKMEVVVHGPEYRLSQVTEFHLLRIVQEAVTNALKHATAKCITVVFRYSADGLLVMVRDDGSGFAAPLSSGSETTRFGILGMRERAAKIPARLAVESQIGSGTTVSVEVSDSHVP